MKAGPLILLLLLSIGAPDEAFSQGHFVRHGFRATMPELVAGPDANSLGFRFGYHFFGLVEAGLAIERRSDFEAEIVTVSLAPGAAVYPVRQSTRSPLTLRLGVAYESQSLSGDPITALEGEGIVTDGAAWRLEAGLSRQAPMSGRLLGRPWALAMVVSALYRDVTIDQGGARSSDETIDLMLEGIFLIDVGGMARVAAGPRIGVLDGGPAVGLTLGLVAGYKY